MLMHIELLLIDYLISINLENVCKMIYLLLLSFSVRGISMVIIVGFLVLLYPAILDCVDVLLGKLILIFN